jgi:hypothetical protein
MWLASCRLAGHCQLCPGPLGDIHANLQMLIQGSSRASQVLCFCHHHFHSLPFLYFSGPLILTLWRQLFCPLIPFGTREHWLGFKGQQEKETKVFLSPVLSASVCASDNSCDPLTQGGWDGGSRSESLAVTWPRNTISSLARSGLWVPIPSSWCKLCPTLDYSLNCTNLQSTLLAVMFFSILILIKEHISQQKKWSNGSPPCP